MDESELVGGVLYDAEDPIKAAAALAQLLTSPQPNRDHARQVGLEPALVESLRHALPPDPGAVQLACAKGAAWVLGRRSAARQDSWELVASLPSDVQLPSGLRRTTAETLIGLVSEAEHSLRFAAPYVDPAGIALLAEVITAATSRGVHVEVFQPARWEHGVVAMERLRTAVERMGDPACLTVTRTRPDAPWAHLKVMVADGFVAYIGSANITAAGLAGRNLELGVLVRGPDVAVVDRILDLYQDR